jgi:hypothetical protein
MSGTHEACFTGGGKVQRDVRLSQPLIPIMRAIVQRVSSASVTGIYILSPFSINSQAFVPPQVASEKISEIGQGLMVLIGMGAGARTFVGYASTTPN